MITILHDTFGGVTAGVTIAGRTPAPTANGSDAWGDFSGAGFGAIGGAIGGGVTSLDLGFANAFATYALTGAPVAQTGTFAVKSAGSTIAVVQLIMGQSASEAQLVALDYGANEVRVAHQVSGVNTVLATEPFTFTPTTSYVVEVELTGSAVSVTIDGTPIITGQAVSPTGGAVLLIGQGSGNVSDIIFTEIKIEVADDAPTTATLSGPTSGVAGSPSADFEVTLDHGAPSGGVGVTLIDSSGGNNFVGTGVSGTTLTIPEGSASGAFKYNRATAGTSSISITAGGLTISGSPISYVAAAPTLAVSPTTGASGSGGIPITLTRTGGSAWTAGTPGTPTFTTSLGKLVGQSVAGTTSASATLLPYYAGGSHVVTDPTNSTTAAVAITAPSATTEVVDAGNSLTLGTSSDGTAIPYPTSLQAILGPLYSVQNSGVGGQSGADIVAGFAAQIGDHYDAGKANILVLWEGTNDLYFDASAADSYAHYVSIAASYKALNPANKVIVLTCLPRSNFPGTSTISGDPTAQLATFESRRQAFNALVRANSGGFDKVVDLAADQRLGFLGCEQDTAYYDGSLVHMNAAGYLIIADKVATAIGLVAAATTTTTTIIRPSVRTSRGR